MNYLNTLLVFLLAISLHAQDDFPARRFNVGISLGVVQSKVVKIEGGRNYFPDGSFLHKEVKFLNPGWARDIGVFGLYRLHRHLFVQLEVRWLSFKTENEYNTYFYQNGIGLTQKKIGILYHKRTAIHLPLLLKVSFGDRIQLNPIIGLFIRGNGNSKATHSFLGYNYGRMSNGVWIPYEDGMPSMNNGDEKIYDDVLPDQSNYGWVGGMEFQIITNSGFEFILTTKFQRAFRRETSVPLNEQKNILIEFGFIYKNRLLPKN